MTFKLALCGQKCD